VNGGGAVDRIAPRGAGPARRATAFFANGLRRFASWIKSNQPDAKGKRGFCRIFEKFQTKKFLPGFFPILKFWPSIFTA
jgi:hypothetical protein